MSKRFEKIFSTFLNTHIYQYYIYIYAHTFTLFSYICMSMYINICIYKIYVYMIYVYIYIYSCKNCRQGTTKEDKFFTLKPFVFALQSVIFLQ